MQCHSFLLMVPHRPGHLGRERTYQGLVDEFYWPGMYADVQRLCIACNECQKVAKLKQKRAPLRPLPVIDIPYNRTWCYPPSSSIMEMVGPLPRTAEGNKRILVIVDHATHQKLSLSVILIAGRVADLLIPLFCHMGVPREILTDCGANFTGKLMRELYSLMDITPLKTTPHHPECDSLVERFNASLKEMLRKTVKLWDGQWDLVLPHTLGEYHRAPHETTGFTPSELLYGQQIRGPLQNINERRTAQEKTPTDIVTYITCLQDRFEAIREASRAMETKKRSSTSSSMTSKQRNSHFNQVIWCFSGHQPKDQALKQNDMDYIQ